MLHKNKFLGTVNINNILRCFPLQDPHLRGFLFCVTLKSNNRTLQDINKARLSIDLRAFVFCAKCSYILEALKKIHTKFNTAKAFLTEAQNKIANRLKWHNGGFNHALTPSALVLNDGKWSAATVRNLTAMRVLWFFPRIKTPDKFGRQTSNAPPPRTVNAQNGQKIFIVKKGFFMSKIEQKLAELDELCQIAAQAHKKAVFCEHNRKVVLAREMIKNEAKGAKSAAIQERDARASQEYQKAIIDLAEAEAESFLARGRYQNQKLMLEVWRTKQANEREQLKHLKDVT